MNAGRHFAEQRHPPRGQFAEINGLSVHYADHGAGDVLVLLHGANSCLEDFRPGLIPALQDRYRVIAVDRPGQGYSKRDADGDNSPAGQAAVVAALLDHLDIPRAVIVGHSFGGSVALAFVLGFSERARGAVLLAPVSHPWGSAVPWYFQLGAVPWLGPLFAHGAIATIGHFFVDWGLEKVFSPNPVPGGFAESVALDLSVQADSFVANARDFSDLDAFLDAQSRLYPSIDLPVLIITGDSDEVVPAEYHARPLAAAIANAELEVMADTGHMLHHVDPGRIAHWIDSFVAALPARDRP